MCALACVRVCLGVISVVKLLEEGVALDLIGQSQEDSEAADWLIGTELKCPQLSLWV